MQMCLLYWGFVERSDALTFKPGDAPIAVSDALRCLLKELLLLSDFPWFTAADVVRLMKLNFYRASCVS